MYVLLPWEKALWTVFRIGRTRKRYLAKKMEWIYFRVGELTNGRKLTAKIRLTKRRQREL